MKEIDVHEFRNRHPQAFFRWIDMVLKNTDDRFYELNDGTPCFEVDGGYQSNPFFVWHDELDKFEEEYPENEEIT